jgi:flagellar biosynthetic protein FliO
VVRDKKKIVAFLIAVALGGGALVVCSAQPPVTEPKETTSYNPYRLSENDSNHAGGPLNTKELFLKMMAAVLLVVVLGVAAIYISKKFLPKIANLPGKRIHILETVHLGPRKAVHLLQIGNQQLLIGSTSEGITALADITDATMDLPSQETDNN